MLLANPLELAAGRGKQKPEKFVNEPADVLEASFAGGNFRQAGLTLKATLSSEEKLEINSVV
jgi:hypothetical protein